MGAEDGPAIYGGCGARAKLGNRNKAMELTYRQIRIRMAGGGGKNPSGKRGPPGSKSPPTNLAPAYWALSGRHGESSSHLVACLFVRFPLFRPTPTTNQ